MSPGGHIDFISKAYPGSIDDAGLTHESGFVDRLEPVRSSCVPCLSATSVHLPDCVCGTWQGDVVGADRGFLIEVMLNQVGASVVFPPFKTEDNLANDTDGQFAEHQNVETHRQAHVRIHIERVVKHIKEWSFLTRTIPTSYLPYLDEILLACCVLTNLTNHPIGPRDLKRKDQMEDILEE